MMLERQWECEHEFKERKAIPAKSFYCKMCLIEIDNAEELKKLEDEYENE